MADLITTPFANTGDKTAPPQTDPDNFVNFELGYTLDYEIDLSSGNSSAKAVERQVQNYLFYLLTSNAQELQKFGAPTWQSGMPNGYSANAVVFRLVSPNTYSAYRSLTNNNVSDPLTNSTGSNPSWEVSQSSTNLIRAIPMPSGGPAGQSAAIITAAVDFNTLTSGTWQLSSDAVATASANSPKLLGSSSSKAGMIESKQWVVSAATMTVQRYTDTNGNLFSRGGLNASWTPWTTGAQSTNYGADNGTVNNVSCSIPLQSATLDDNKSFWAKIAFTNTGSVSFTPNAALIPVPLPVVGMGNLTLGPGAIVAGGRAHFLYKADTNNFVLVGCSGGTQQVAPGTTDDVSATLGQVKKIVTSSALTRFLSQL